MNELKTLFLDIETAPLLSYTWNIWDQNIGLNQIKDDWCIIAWAAKWRGEKKVFYQDNRGAKNVREDKKLLKPLLDLMNAADVIITQNGKSFDAKKINARLIMNGYKPPRPFRHIDTKRIAKRMFGFTSNRLEYMTEKLCVKHRKLSHRQFPGFELWKECLAGNKAAWKVMEDYNKADVLSLEELYEKLAPWDNTASLCPVIDISKFKCSCGSKTVIKNGFRNRSGLRYQRYACSNCGATYIGEVVSKSDIPRHRRLRRE